MLTTAATEQTYTTSHTRISMCIAVLVGASLSIDWFSLKKKVILRHVGTPNYSVIILFGVASAVNANNGLNRPYKPFMVTIP